MDRLFTYTLPLLGGLLLALLVVDLLIGKRDGAAKRSRIVLTVIVSVVEGGLIAWRILHTSHPDPFITQPRATLIADPLGETALATEAHLNGANIPVYDPDTSILALAPGALSMPLSHHNLGDRLQFSLHDRLAEAELLYVNEPVYVWLVVGLEADQKALQSAVDRFVAEVLPAVRQYFAFQKGDFLIHIVHYRDPSDGMHGFFLPETGVFHVNLARQSPEEVSYLGTLVHELQHALHWHVDPNEERWLDEGLSGLAQLVTDFDPGRSDEIFREAFDTQLNYWPYDGEGEPPTANYGASYRFVLYLWEQFGDDLIRDLSQHPGNGLPSIDAVLAAHQTGFTADEVFADWVLANAVDEGEYRYDHEDWEPSLPTWAETTFYRYPIDIQSTVQPYATDYFRLENTRPALIRFSGTTQARLLPEKPHSGETCWWSNAIHHSNTQLTRSIDLSTLSTARLRFWTWYDMESEGSHAYLSASGDGGETWTVLQTYGGQSNGWIEQHIDLSAYAGAQVQLRFDYVTRHGAHDKGFLLDDLFIPELGLEDACEEIGDWQAEGFILAGAMVPVRWVVQVIDVYREGHSLQVYRMPLDEAQTGELEMELRLLGGLLGNKGRGILAISALARGTTEPLPYRCEIVRP